MAMVHIKSSSWASSNARLHVVSGPTRILRFGSYLLPLHPSETLSMLTQLLTNIGSLHTKAAALGHGGEEMI